MENLKALCSVFLPKDTLIYFDVTDVSTTDDEIHINLTEKDNSPQHKKELKAKGFKTVVVSDFPIRGKKSVLTYHRRYWQAEGEKEFITSEIPLVHTGTKLERDFAEVLKKLAETIPTSLASIATLYRLPAKEFEKQYKDHLSGFRNWDQLDHADK
jgi:transposase